MKLKTKRSLPVLFTLLALLLALVIILGNQPISALF